MKNGGSKILTAVIAFILGIVIAITAEIGFIVALLNLNFNTIFNAANFSNEDSDGRQYINTDEENGGSKNVISLVNNLMTLGANITNSTVADITVMFPAFEGLTDSLYTALNEYVEIDKEEINQTKFDALGSYITGKIMNIRPAKLISKFGADGLVGDDANAIIKAILMGVEADYVTYSSSKYPVYYDEYTLVEGDYYRGVGTSDAYPTNLVDVSWLTDMGKKDADNDDQFRQYFYAVTDGETTKYYVTKLGDDGNYQYTTDLENTEYLADYGADGIENNRLTGNYYYDANGEQVEVKPVTLASIAQNPLEPLNSVPLTSLLGTESDIMDELFGTASIGDIINGTLDVDNLIDNLKLASFVDVTADNAILAYIGYGLTNVTPASGTDYQYTATYNPTEKDQSPIDCFVSVDENLKITSVYYIDANKEKVEITGTAVAGIKPRMDGVTKDLALGDLMTVTIDNNILAYIGFGITNITKISDTLYTATYSPTEDGKSPFDCYVTVDDATQKITSVFYFNGENKISISGTSVDDVSVRVKGVTNDLALGDLMDITIDNNILVYIGYGVTNIVAAETTDYQYTATFKPIDKTAQPEFTCYIQVDKDNDNKITSVFYYNNGEKISINGTSVNNISARVKAVTSDLALSDIIDVTIDNKILAYVGYGLTNITKITDTLYSANYKYITTNAVTECYVVIADAKTGKIATVYAVNDKDKTPLAGTTIAQVSTRINDVTNDLALGDLMDVTVDSNILAYIGYGIKNITASDVENVYDATYVSLDETPVKISCKVKVDDNNKIISVYYTEKNGDDNATITLPGTTIAQVSKRVNNVTNDLAIGDMIDITTDSILAYIGYGVKHLVAVPDNNKLFTATYTPLDSDEQIPCFVEISDTETKIITSAYYTTNGNKVNIEGTSIANVSKRVSGVTNDLALGDIVEIDESNTILYAIKDSSINNIPTTINALSIQELFTSDIYGVSTPYTVVASDATVNDGEINFNTDYLYYIKDTETGKFVLINNNATDGSRGKFAVGTEFPTDQTYYTYGKPTGTWKFMLYKTVTIKSAEPDVPDIVYSGEQTYSVNSMNSLMSNVTANINTATISDLQEAGIIGKDVKIDQDIPVIKDTANKIFYTKQAKNCTIDDILGSVDYLTSQDYALALLKKTNSALYPDAYDILPATTSGD